MLGSGLPLWVTRQRLLVPVVCGSMSEVAPHCATEQKNTHGTAVREFLYPSHLESGRLVHVHQLYNKGIADFRCCLTSDAAGRPVLEVDVDVRRFVAFLRHEPFALFQADPGARRYAKIPCRNRLCESVPASTP